MKKTKCSENRVPQLTSQYFDVLFSVFHVVLIVNFTFEYKFQKRDRALSAPAEARLLCEAGHAGHPHRPAHDLHPAPHVHRDLHEEVTVLPPPSRPAAPAEGTTAHHLLTVPFLCSILPFEAVVCMYRFLGADKCMYPFIAQRKQATNNNEAKNGI